MESLKKPTGSNVVAEVTQPIIHLIEAQITACSPLMKFGTQERETDKTTGVEMFELFVKEDKIKKLGVSGLTAVTTDYRRIKSLVEIKPSTSKVLLEVLLFPMSDEGTKKVTLHMKVTKQR